MFNITSNLRKAAVLIRSLDGETAAKLLAQLSAEETAAIRQAICSLGTIDEDERAGVATELRCRRPITAPHTESGVELNLTSCEIGEFNDAICNTPASGKRFEFLENAPIETIAVYLAREHVQTTAVVLAHLTDSRAAAVLGALPAKRQADTLERLSQLGESDPESLSAVEHELATWAARQPVARRKPVPTSGAVQSILAAADESTRGRILVNLRQHNQRLAAQLDPVPAPSSARQRPVDPPRLPPALSRFNRAPIAIHPRTVTVAFMFDDLIHLKDAELKALIRDVNPQLLRLALVGSSEELVERIANRMPKQQAKAFRRQLRELGPTRLSDVEAAQRTVAHAAGHLRANLSARDMLAST